MTVVNGNGGGLPAMAEAWTGVGESWVRQSEAWLDRASRVGMTALRPSQGIDDLNRLADRLTSVNAKYVEDLMDAWLAGTSAVLEHIAGLTNVFNDQFRTVANIAAETTEQMDDAVRQQNLEAERAARSQARQIQRAERERAASRYVELTKAELSEALAERDLPRSGTVDELRERLVEDDLQGGRDRR